MYLVWGHALQPPPRVRGANNGLGSNQVMDHGVRGSKIKSSSQLSGSSVASGSIGAHMDPIIVR